MMKKNHWSVPGFTCLAMLALSACTGGGSGGGTVGGSPSTGGGSGGGGTPPVADFTVPNPYAVYGADDATEIGTLTVFGDSYSDPKDAKRSCASIGSPCLAEDEMWSSLLVGGDTDRLDSFALGEASASAVNVYYDASKDLDGDGIDENGEDRDNTLNRQVDQWLAGTPATGENDLTIFYMGYNDINKVQFKDGKLRGPAADAVDNYADQLDRVLDAGAGSGDGKVFVTLVHDWGSTPAELAKLAARCAGSADPECEVKKDYSSQKTVMWNDGVAAIANARDDVIAVDMYTPFERIMADPAKYGFDNVTTADAAESDDGALYFDSRHFGARGQAIIAEVYNHYLTRGWDWANNLSAGAAAVAQLNDDIDKGLLFSLDAQGDRRLGLSTFFVGSAPSTLAAHDALGSPSRSSFDALSEDTARNSGLGINYALDNATMFGLVFSNYNDRTSSENASQSAELDYEGDGVSFYFRTQLAGLQLSTTSSFLQEQNRRSEHDSLVGASNSASFGGSTMQIRQTASLPQRLGSAWFTPWLSLEHTRRKVDDYTISNPYVTDTTYSGAEVGETFASIGLDMQGDTFAIGDEGWFSLRGGLSYSQSLQLDDYRVRMSEAGIGGVSQSETLERDGVQVFGLRAGAAMGLGESLSFSADYAMSQQVGLDLQQSLMMRLNYRF